MQGHGNAILFGFCNRCQECAFLAGRVQVLLATTGRQKAMGEALLTVLPGSALVGDPRHPLIRSPINSYGKTAPHASFGNIGIFQPVLLRNREPLDLWGGCSERRRKLYRTCSI